MFAIAFIISPGCQRKELLNSSGRPSQFTGEGNRLGRVGLGFQPGGESHRTPSAALRKLLPIPYQPGAPQPSADPMPLSEPQGAGCVFHAFAKSEEKKKGGGSPGQSRVTASSLDSPSELGGAVGAKAARCSQRGAGTRRRPRAQAPPLSPGRSLLRSQLQPLSRPSTEPRERGSSQPGG